MNLISGTYYSYERKEYAFMVLQENTIIFLKQRSKNQNFLVGTDS